MKKAILNMKAFYISLFVVLFFPLGLMGQEPIYTKLEEGSVICFESKYNGKQYIMAVTDNGDYNYTLSAKLRTNDIWSDMTIWWEVTRINKDGGLGLKSLIYDCYLKSNLTGNDKYYSLTTKVSEATLLGFVDANETAKILLTLKPNADKTKATSWYVGVEKSYESEKYQFCAAWHWSQLKCDKKVESTYSQNVFKYYRPQYNGSKWIAATNIAERDLHDCDVIPSGVKESDDYLSTLIEVYVSTWARSDITSKPKPKIYYSPKVVLGGIDFGKIEGLDIDLCKVLAFFCPPTDAQAYLLSNFNVEHQKGASGRDLDEKGLQSVHTFTEVIYAKPNDMVNLRLQVEDTKAYASGFWDQLVNSIVDDKYLNGFYRWFNYEDETDEEDIINSSLTHTKSVTSGIFGSNVTQLPVNYLKTNKGDVLLKGMGPGRTDFKMVDKAIKIACDVSNYSDYDFTCDITNGKIVLKEPTLSYRMIYDIRPASEMAAQLDNCTATPLESYTIVAPVPVPTDPNKKEGKQITIGPKYRWTGDRCNYYSKKSNPAKITSPTWYKNGSRFTPTDIIDDRLISIEGPNEDGKIGTYTLKSGNLIIAEFKVVGRDIDKVGPRQKEIPFPKGYDPTDPSSLTPAYTETFDRSSKDEFEQPLPWDNISYGFVYNNFSGSNNLLGKLNDNRGRKGYNNNKLLPHWSEYSYIGSTTVTPPIAEIFAGIESHSKPEGKNCRFLYCNGTNTPGKVADFVINGDLCPASKIFLSAWVVHTFNIASINDNWITEMSGGTSVVYPNLNFSIIGIMNDGTETPITTFTTGDLDTRIEEKDKNGNIIKDKNGNIIISSKWHHIFFEFETTQVDYDQYRIRIENNNASIYNIGNEFGIDDIRVWTTTKTAATVSQRFMSCHDWSLETKDQIGKSNIALLRAELDNTPATGATMYYAWLKKDGVNDTISLELQHYIGQPQFQTSRYGTIYVNKGWTEETAPEDIKNKFYDKVNNYLATIEGRTDDFSDYFFTRENNELVLYIVHKDKLFQQNEKYYSIVTTLDLSGYTTSKALVELFQNLQCGTLSYFEVLPYSRAFLAKQEGNVYKKYGDYDFTEAITKHLAEGETYNFVVEAYSPAVIDDRDTIVSYNCHADWLLVTDDDTKWTDAQAIINWQANRNAPLKLSEGNTLKTSDGSANSFQVENFSGPSHYIAIPDPNKAVDVDGDGVGDHTPCAIPVEIYLYDSIPATLADPNVSDAVEEGENVWKYDRPEEICNEPIIVRIPNSLVGKDNFTLNLDIDYFDEYLFAEIAKYNEKENEKTQGKNLYPLNNIYLYDANGQPVATPIKFNITTTAKDENNQTLTLDLLKKNDDVAISGGHDFASGQKYHFAGHNVVNGVTITPPFQFDVYVVPDEVVWTGDKDKSTAWHKDANWNPAFIPMSHTNVVIPGNTTNKPVLKPSATEFEAGAYEWLEHDIVLTKNEENVLVDNTSAVLNSCKDIYFEAGAQLVNQHMLNYERAFVDVPFTNDSKFKIMSFPLRNVYRGDLYIPRNYDENTKKDIGDGDFDFDFPKTGGQFEAVPVDNRAYNSFYVKAYNSAIQKNTVSIDETKPEQKVVKVEDYSYGTTGGWSNPTSVLNFKFEEAHGYAVSLKATTAQSFVRLPKSATEYYLFMNFGNGNEKELQGSTWPKYEIPELQLKGDKRIRSSEGHKLVYDKDHGASVTFTNKVGNIFLIGNPFMTDMKVKKFLVDNNLKSNVYYTYSDGIINVTVTPTDADIIPPFGAMFVEGNSNTQAFTFTSEMMSDTESPTQQRAPRMVEERELLTITAEVDGARSRIYIEKDFAANNEYLDTEDADLLVLDADLTPISVYSVATGAALAYNSVTDMEFVPLGLLLVDSTIVAESVRFTFDGVDYFYDELYLYDALYNSYLPLIDGVALELEMPESGELRYFITDTKHNVGGGVTTSDDLVEGSKVCVFTTDGEACIIAEDIISEATVYDIAGRLIYYSDQISSSQHNISLPNGVYMLKVVVNSNLSTHKIILK